MSDLSKRLEGPAKLALEVIGELAESGAASNRAELALAVINTIVKNVAAGFAGRMTAVEVIKAIHAAREDLKTSLANNDAETQSEIDKKFPTG